MMKRTNRALSILLTLAMLASLLPASVLPAYAASEVTKTFSFSTATLTDDYLSIKATDPDDNTQKTILTVNGTMMDVYINSNPAFEIQNVTSAGSGPGNEVQLFISPYVDGKVTKVEFTKAGRSNQQGGSTFSMSIDGMKYNGTDDALTGVGASGESTSFTFISTDAAGIAGNLTMRLGVDAKFFIDKSAGCEMIITYIPNVEPTHSHDFTFNAVGNTLTATCGHSDGLDCSLADANYQATLTLTPPAESFYRPGTYYSASHNLPAFNTQTGLNGTTDGIRYTTDGTNYTADAPNAIGDYTARLIVNIGGTDYTLTTSFRVSAYCDINNSYPQFNISTDDYASTTMAGEGQTVTLTFTPRYGETLTGLTVTGATTNYSIGNGITDNSNNTYTFTMPAEEVTIGATFTISEDDFAQSGDTYTIKTANGWGWFCFLLEHDSSLDGFSGKTVKLANSISVAKMAGSSAHKFKGTFDGQGKTLTFNYTTTDNSCGLFYYTDGATIQNLHVTGSITGGSYLGGLVGTSTGNITIRNCHVSTSVSGTERYNGGIVGGLNGNATFTGCVFDGTDVNSSLIGGFVGYDYGTVGFTDCLFAPSNDSSHYTFIFDGTNSTFTNCYFTTAFSETYSQGTTPRTVTAGDGVSSVTVAPVGDATATYNVSGITAYGKGIKRGDTFYYGSGDQVSLTLAHADAPSGQSFSGYTASAGTLSGTENPYSLTMPDADVTIGATFEMPPHTHNFNYSATGGTITATCDNTDGNCPLDNHKATLTITAPTGDLTYDGTVKGATVTGEIPGVTTPDIVYTKDGAAFTGTPTAAGAYTASITVEGATASVSYTIAPKSVTIAGLSASEKVYDGTTTATATGTATINGKVDGDDVTVTAGTAAFDNANVGTGKTVTFSGYSLSGSAAGNYTLSAQPTSVTANITARPITVTAADQSVELNGSIAQGTDKVSVSNGTLVSGHSISAVTLTASSTASVGSGTITPSTATIKSGTTDVTANYNISYENGTLTVTPTKPIIDTALTASAITYGQTLNDSTISGSMKNKTSGSAVEGTFAWKDSTTAPAVSDSNTTEYEWVFTPTDTTNYGSVEGKLKVAVNKKSVTITDLSVSNKEYDGTTTANATGGTIDGKVGNDNVSFTAGTAAFADANVGTGKTVTFSGYSLTGTAAGNYTLSAQPASVTADITQRAITIKAADQSVELGGNIATGTDKVSVTSGTLVSGHSISAVTLTASSTANTTTSGTITPGDIVIKDANNNDVTSNYAITPANGVLTVTKIKAKVTTAPTANNRTYDGTEKPLLTGGEADTSLEYSTDGTTYAATVPQGTNADTYTVYYRAAADNDHDPSDAAQISVTIDKAAATVTAADASKGYGATDPASFTATVTGMIGGDTLTYTVARAAGENVGTYAITPSGDATQGNYTVTYVPGTFTISKASITPTVEVTGGPYTYTGSAITPTFTVKNGDTSLASTDYTVQYSDNVNAGTCTITVKAASGGNYTFTQVEKTFDIGKIAWTNKDATATVRRGSTTTVQLANYVAPGGTLGAASPSAYTVSADTKTITINAASDATLGDFAVTIPVSNATNHNDYNITLTVTVTDKTPQTISFASGTVSKTYGDAAFTNALSGAHTSVSYTVTSGADVAEVDSTGKVTIKKAGLATIKATAAATAEYAGATATFTLNVGKANATVTAYHKTKYVGENDPSFDAKVEGLVNGDAESVIVYTITRDVGEGVGEYAIKLTGDAEQGNYNVTFVNGKLTIKPAKIDVSSVTLNRTTLPLTVGGTATLTATVEPSNASEPEVTWTSGTPTVATVDANGKVTARSAGTAIITATADGKSATCTVTVTASTPTPTPTPSYDPTPSGRDDTPSTPSNTTTTTDKAATTNADGGKTESTSKTTETKNSDGSTTAKTTETATTTAADGSKTESKSETSTTTKANTDGTTTASTTATQTAVTTAADGTKTTTEIKTEAKETLDKSGNGTVEAKTTETVKDANGKVTETTVTESRGTVETAADGAKTTTTTNTATTTDADGNVTTTVTTEKAVEAADGSTGSVVTNENGETVSATATISEKAVEQAQKSGDAVTVPVTVTATNDAATATAVEITVPQGAESVKVEIPVENVKPGTVAVIVNPDGTEEIVKTSTTSDEGVVLTLDAGATVKLVDNAKPMNDVKGDEWYADSVAWATSHEVMNGMGDGSFAPNAPTTQGMMEQLLYNLDGNALVPAAEDEEWWSAADRWADGESVTQGLGDAHDPVAPATREVDALMMFNYAKAKGYDVSARADLSRFPDAANVSEEAHEALAWAVAAGLINGTTDENGNVILDPQGVATRAQVSAIIERFCENVAK